MYRLVVRNTFLSFEEDGEAGLAAGGFPRRSKSVGDRPDSARHDDDEEEDTHLRRPSHMLREDPLASPGRPATPPPAPEGGVGVHELGQLQQKLREAASPVGLPATAAGCCALPKVTSSSSVSTMVRRPSLRSVDSSTSVYSMARPSLRHVGSSNSVSSMASEPPRGGEASAEGRSPPGGAHAGDFRASAPANVPVTQDARCPRLPREPVHSSPPAPKDYCHNQVPKKCDLAKNFARSELRGPPTTMMIRNIPNHYTQCHMVHELETLGFQNSYDFLYVPIDRGTQGSVGYCFVNFVAPEWAARCAQAFNGRPFEKRRRDRRGKVAEVSVAHLQGLEANLRHYRNAAVTDAAQASKGHGPIVVASLSRALS